MTQWRHCLSTMIVQQKNVQLQGEDGDDSVWEDPKDNECAFNLFDDDE